MRRIVALLCVAQFMVVLDATIVAVALPSIRAALGLGPASLEWVVSAYTLTFGGLLVPAGRIGDALGRRRALRVGFALFTLASLACGAAPSAAVLLGARAIQGAGAALVAPAALALLNEAVGEGPARGGALAAWTAAAAGGGASGWVLGGLLASGPGWRWVFLANVPLGIAVTVLARRLPAGTRTARGGLALGNGAVLTVALALLGLGLTRAQQAGPSAAWAPLAGAVLAAAVFARLERRAERPLLPPSLLRSARFARAGGAALVLTGTTTPAMFLAILYQHQVLGRGPLATGLGCMPFNLAVIAGSIAGPRLLARAGERRAMALGLVTVAAGVLALSAVAAARAGGAGLLAAFATMGVGLGCASVASTAAGTADPAAGDEGVTSGVLTAAAQVGTALGLATLVTLAAARAAAAGFVAGLGLALPVTAAIALLAAAAVVAPLARSRRGAGAP